MTDLPTLYAAVVAKRPDLAVYELSFGFWWELEFETVRDTTAAALIFDHWYKSLPAFQRLYMTDGDVGAIPGSRKWLVEDHIEGTHTGLFETPLEALAAFYLGETT